MNFHGDSISPAEADLLVRGLRPIAVSDIGSSQWKEQREAIEQLNMCAHSNAALKKDDFVKSFLLEHEKLVVLLHELLAMEAWRHNVLPSVQREIVDNPSAVYMYGYYESVLVNLLECLMFYEEVVVGFGDDILELIDYLWRQLSALFAEGRTVNDIDPPIDPKKLQEEDPVKHLQRQLRATGAVRTMGCVSCLWFIVDRTSSLSMAVMNSLLIKNDLVVGLSEIIVLQPWMRRGPGEVQKFIGGQFTKVPMEDMLRICPPEAHLWFALHKLLCDRECRKKYQYTSFKKEIILKTKRFLNETIVDQIPALADVQRALEELSFLEPPSGTEEKFRNSLVIEQMPRIRAAIDNGHRQWGDVVAEMKRKLQDPRSKMEDAQRIARLFDKIFAEQLKDDNK
jgi:hypothetical protein